MNSTNNRIKYFIMDKTTLGQVIANARKKSLNSVRTG